MGACHATCHATSPTPSKSPQDNLYLAKEGDTILNKNLKAVRTEAKIPDGNEVLIEVAYVFLNQDDLLNGDHHRGSGNRTTPIDPKRPPAAYVAHCFSGVIRSVSPNSIDALTNFQIGDKVFGFDNSDIGALCEFVTVSIDHVRKVPVDCDLQKAAALPHIAYVHDNLMTVLKEKMKVGFLGLESSYSEEYYSSIMKGVAKKQKAIFEPFSTDKATSTFPTKSDERDFIVSVDWNPVIGAFGGMYKDGLYKQVWVLYDRGFPIEGKFSPTIPFDGGNIEMAAKFVEDPQNMNLIVKNIRWGCGTNLVATKEQLQDSLGWSVYVPRRCLVDIKVLRGFPIVNENDFVMPAETVPQESRV